MKFIVEVQPDKAALFEDFLESLPYVEILDAEPSKQDILQGLKEAVEEVARIKAGKATGRDAFEFLNELQDSDDTALRAEPEVAGEKVPVATR